MVSRMRKGGKKPSPLRNVAVQTVGETYFFLSMAGIAIAGVLAIATVASGSTRGMFLFHLDRCDCLLTSSSQSSGEDASASCIYGEDRIEANIGWKRFVITKAVSTNGCLDDWEGTSNIGSSFGTGIIQKATTNYGNGAIISANASVGLFVVSAIVSIVMFKTIKMCFYGPGSIYSIGLHNIAILCLLLSIASGISITTFWGRIQGGLGDIDTSLAAILYDATVYACREEWNDGDGSDFCDDGPWSFRVPLYASAMAIAHVSVMFLTSVWLLTKSSFVEGLLDGSVLSCGKLITPRAVEYEQAVGKALASTGNPDYDDNNALYVGGSNMIRPYPLPRTAKAKTQQKEVAEAENTIIVSPLRKMPTPTNDYPQSWSSASVNSVESPKSSLSGERPGSE